MSLPEVTLVIPTYRRRENLVALVRHAASTRMFGEIVVWNNDHEEEFKPHEKAWQFGKAHAVNSPWNVGPYGRFIAARKAAFDTICTQDDDYIVNNWPVLLDHYRAIGSNELVANVFYERRNGKVAETAQIKCSRGYDIMLGWGSVFDRRWIDAAFKPYLDAHGCDPLFVRKADRIFSIMLAREHVEAQADVTPLAGANEPPALHYTPLNRIWTQEARKRCRDILEATK